MQEAVALQGTIAHKKDKVKPPGRLNQIPLHLRTQQPEYLEEILHMEFMETPYMEDKETPQMESWGRTRDV